MQIVIYSTTTCPYCKMLRDYLNEKRIVYSEKLIDQDEKALKEMGEVSHGFLGVPFTVVTSENGDKNTIIGFDKDRLNSILRI